MKWPWTRGRSREQSLSDYFDGALRGREERDVEATTTSDPAAQRRLADYARLRDAVRAARPLNDEQPDADYLAAVMRRVAEAEDVQAVRSWRWRWVAAPVSGIAALAAVALTWRAVAPDVGAHSDAPELARLSDAEKPAQAKPRELSMHADGERVDVTEDLALARRRAGEAPQPAGETALASTYVAKAQAAGATTDHLAALARSGEQTPGDDRAASGSPALDTAGASRMAATLADARASTAAAARQDPQAVALAPAASPSYASDGAKLLPYTLQIVESGAKARVVGLEGGAEMAFGRNGVTHTVSVTREPDGRWSISSAYMEAGALVATGRRERLIRLSGADVDHAPSGSPLARFRIAQPLVGTERLYAEVIATGDAAAQSRSAPKVEEQADAPD